MADVGLRRKLQFKMAKNSKDFEETVMTDEFYAQKKAYNDYEKVLGQLVYRLESAVQPNDEYKNTPTVEAPAGKEPMDQLYIALKEWNTLLGTYKDPKGRFKAIRFMSGKLIESIIHAVDCKRQMQRASRGQIGQMRKFHSQLFPTFKKNWETFEAARDKMDLARHEVKQAKNTMEIEKRAVLYKEAVEQFDTHCTAFLQTLEELPKLQKTHAGEVKAWFHAQRDYHKKMTEFF